ncbi:MAG: hypothetical protein MUP74_04260, partial [Desulfobacterales bacterium]|nr:hypothetical protein [Desulfobacterales bacterium]
MKIKSRSVARQVPAFVALTAGFFLVFGLLLVNGAHAATAKEIDVSVDVALERFHNEIKGGKEFLASAKGVLVFP